MEQIKKSLLLPHHEQQSLCTMRLPYRQGRRLTAVKVYSITKESNHILIFGVPSLNLRQETKALFIKFGKLLKFNISDHPTEPFTETYHAQYERIQSARVAKRMIDTKNFYGGVLHVCYAPELESIAETRQKLIQRQRDVVYRLRNLDREMISEKKLSVSQVEKELSIKINMGEENVIRIGVTDGKNRKMSKKRKMADEKQFKACFVQNKKYNEENSKKEDNKLDMSVIKNIQTQTSDVDIVDCTSVEEAVVTNINEHLNYNKFGNEIIRKVPEKTENRIKFFINKKS